jgi:hypothetical protein
MIKVSIWKVERGQIMDIMDQDNSKYLQLAIETVFFLNKDRIQLHTDVTSKETIIKDMSSEIMSRAKRFKLLTSSFEELV